MIVLVVCIHRLLALQVDFQVAVGAVGAVSDAEKDEDLSGLTWKELELIPQKDFFPQQQQAACASAGGIH